MPRPVPLLVDGTLAVQGAPGMVDAPRCCTAQPCCLSALQVRLGPNGVEEFLPLGELTSFEQAGLEKMKGLLTKNIEAGVEFASKA